MTAAVPEAAVVLCAGLGTRLRPLTYVRAKPAVPGAGETLIRRILRRLAGAGVRTAVVNLHHLPHTITREVGDAADLGVKVRYSWEPRILGSGGGPRLALDLLETDRAWIVNGDTLTDVSLEAMATAHARSGARVTLALVDNPTPHRYGGIAIDEAGRVRRFVGPGSAERSWHFVGVQLVERDVYDGVLPGEPVDSLRQVYRPLMDQDARAVQGFVSHASFADLGIPADYMTTCATIARAEGRTATTPGFRSRIDPTAHLERTILWDAVEIGPNVTLRGCIVTDGVAVPAGTVLDDTMILLASDVPEGIGARTMAGLALIPLVGAEAGA